jgi:hypothetical protein
VLCGVLWGHLCPHTRRQTKAGDCWAVLSVWWVVLIGQPLFQRAEVEAMAQRAAEDATQQTGYTPNAHMAVRASVGSFVH